jgi:hypothetical protein
MRRSRAGSTAGLAAEEGRGRTILRVLDSLVRPKLGDNATLLAQWKTTRQIKRLRSIGSTTPAPAPTPTPPGASSPQPAPAAEVTLAAGEVA